MNFSRVHAVLLILLILSKVKLYWDNPLVSR